MTTGDRYRNCRSFNTDTPTDGFAAPRVPRWRNRALAAALAGLLLGLIYWA